MSKSTVPGTRPKSRREQTADPVVKRALEIQESRKRPRLSPTISDRAQQTFDLMNLKGLHLVQFVVPLGTGVQRVEMLPVLEPWRDVPPTPESIESDLIEQFLLGEQLAHGSAGYFRGQTGARFLLLGTELADLVAGFQSVQHGLLMGKWALIHDDALADDAFYVCTFFPRRRTLYVAPGYLPILEPDE